MGLRDVPYEPGPGPAQRPPEWGPDVYIGENLQEELSTRLKLRNYPRLQNSLQLLPGLMPVTVVDDYLEEIELKSSGNVSITSTGSYTFFTVPRGERWRLLAVQLLLATGTYKFDRVFLRDDTAARECVIHKGTSAAELYSTFGQRIPVNENWWIRGYCDDWTVIGNATMGLLVQVLKS